ncbi:metallophosphoesterase [Mesorhizobium sp. ANAO-SY3R2]|uniref:metallophosphoesterase n=1 Tax=Mesorhizobium sp. ANAO-SY3R2 TaxID=3166644 RepID=UPI00366EF39C
MANYVTRRRILAQTLGIGLASLLKVPAARTDSWPKVDATFLFAADVHTCRMGDGLSPHCQAEGKTDENLRRHIAALNEVGELAWPREIGGVATGLAGVGQRIGRSLGLVIGGDMTDDGGGQAMTPREGTQLLQFSQRYQQGAGPDQVHVPVYVGLGNHDLDQDGPPEHVDRYRHEMRDYVELNHRPGVFFKPLVPVANYDALSDSYSWDWGGLHLVQAHRFAGDMTKGAISALPWLEADLKTKASDGRPVILFQHYGWDPFSTERWDPAAHKFDATGSGKPHWWSDDERRALSAAIDGYNVLGIFHGHQHDTPMIYRAAGLDLFKPKAAFMGGFAVVHITDDFMDVALAEATPNAGIAFTNAFSKRLDSAR